ncbi:MAG: 50S ribosomal protein L24 [Methanomicrobiales archaeon]
MSKQPRKQRKFIHNAPLHKRNKMMGVTLSDELKSKYEIRSLPVRSGDTVRVMRGNFKDHEGKVEKIDLKHYKVMVEGVIIKKPDGNQVYSTIHPSNLMIVELNLDDDERNQILERKG